MKKTIDCLFIGHNETDFTEYEKNVREMGTNSGAYRDLNLNFIQYNYRPYTVQEIFNLFNSGSGGSQETFKAVDVFSNAIAYLGTYLDRRGYSFDYVNSFRDEKDRLAQKLEQENILVIAVITTLYVTVFPITEIMKFIKKHNRTARVIIGGPFIANQVKGLGPAELEYLFESVDADVYVDSAQGEATLVKLIDAFKDSRSLEQINNIHYKNNGKYAVTPLLKEDNKLEENMVNWDLFADRANRFVNVRTAISCPFSCAFCGLSERTGKYQVVGVETIEKEFDRLNRIETVKSIQVIDDTFNVPVDRFKDILRMLIRKKYRFRWHSHFRCQFADRETVALMKEAGCEGVFLGIESGNDQILKNMNKAATVEKYRNGIALLKEYGILTYGSFIFGFPGETMETAADTIRFIKESGIDFYRAQLWYYEIFSPIWRQREKYNITGSHFEWSHGTMDSKTACGLVDRTFLSVDEAVWVPQHSFECEGLFQVLHRGYSVQQLKDMVNAFNNGIKEKLTNPASKEISFGVVKQLKKHFRGREEETGEEKSIDEKYDAGFDY
ncbi:MAG: PhpK family radical SAM P-methyltransferase [bacterium]|nr:PhpK family radical SAM P-methyltransferase [bacterium]